MLFLATRKLSKEENTGHTQFGFGDTADHKRLCTGDREDMMLITFLNYKRIRSNNAVLWLKEVDQKLSTIESQKVMWGFQGF